MKDAVCSLVPWNGGEVPATTDSFARVLVLGMNFDPGLRNRVMFVGEVLAAFAH
jgi:hypothetical protein